jgi:putative ABC transport system permease protein
MITLSNPDLAIAAVLVLALALLSARLQADVSRQLLIAAARTAIQLTLIGLVLKTLFANVHLVWVTLMALFMLLVAGREVMARQKRRFRGWWGYALGTVSMFLSSFTVAVFAVVYAAIRHSAARHAARQHHERHRHCHGPPDDHGLGAARDYRGAPDAGTELG